MKYLERNMEERISITASRAEMKNGSSFKKDCLILFMHSVSKRFIINLSL